MVQVEVLTGPQGGGKSTVMRQEALQNPGLYLFALPTIELLQEQVEDFFKADKLFTTVPIHKDSGSGSTSRRLTEAREKFEADGVKRGAIFTTHETLMSHDLAGFEGWHARIDEAPAAIQAGRFNIGVTSRSGLKKNYGLEGPADSKWFVVRPMVAKPSYKAVDRDDGAQAFKEFIKQSAREDRAFVNAPDWDHADDIDWFSMWTPLSLSSFASVQIAGSSYTKSVGYLAARKLFDDRFDFSEREIKPPRTGQPSIEIGYFTQGHEGSTTFWATSEGRLRIKQVCDWLGSNLTKSSFWSGNEVVQHLMEHRLQGTLIKPMAMGLNKHRQATQCAFIFSSKATPKDTALKNVFELSDDDIRRARQDDAIAQFVMRGAIRDLDYSGLYSIYLYEEAQASRLRDQLLQNGFTSVVAVGVADAGLMDQVREKVGRKEPSPEEKAKRKKRRADEAVKRAKRNRDKNRKAKDSLGH